MMDKCDICDKETNAIVDCYANICQDCNKKVEDGSYNMDLVRKIGQLKNKQEEMEVEVIRRLTRIEKIVNDQFIKEKKKC
jgi:ribosomal protein L37AE/L43A